MTSAVLLTFGAALLLAVATSAFATRSPLSTTLVFLVAGMLAGPLFLDVVSVSNHTAELAAEVALFAILFTDGQHLPARVLRRSLSAPARALFLGMPLTFILVAAAGHWIAGLPWPAALVLGAVLAPTDPVFASALVGREDVPTRVRHTLNVESGVNDGLALPAVLVLVGTAGGNPEGWSTELHILLLEALLGVALGVALPFLVGLLLRVPGMGSEPRLRPLGPLAIALLLLGLCTLTDANQFLAAFVAGVTIASIRPAESDAFRPTGELVSEMAKGAALIAFASLLDTDTLRLAGVSALFVALVVIVITRPLPVLLVLLGSDLSQRERMAVAWFGPKGFASVAYAVIVLSSGMEGAQEVFALTTVAVFVSVLAHSSTDVSVARALTRDPTAKPGRPR